MPINSTSRNLKDIYSVILLATLSVIFWWKCVLLGQTLYFMDINQYFHPWKRLAAEAIRGGSLPLWTPYNSCGFPLHAIVEAAIFYPPSWIFCALPFDAALDVFVVLHYFLGGLFTFLMMRRWDVNRIGALTSAIVFMFNGCFVASTGFLSHLGSMIWMPLVFLLIDRAMEERRLFSIMLAGTVIGLQFLGGFPEYVLQTMLAVGLFWLAKLFFLIRAPGQGLQKERYRSTFWSVCAFPLAAAFGLAVCAVQLLPLIELKGLSMRSGGVPLTEAARISLPPRLQLIGWLTPFLFGGPGEGGDYGFFQFWLRSFYVGIFPIVMSLFALVCCAGVLKADASSSEDVSRRRRARVLTIFFAALLILSAFLAAGKFENIYRIFHEVMPLFGLFRWPAKMIYLGVFSLTVLSGIGVSCVFDFSGRREKEEKQRRSFLSAILSPNPAVRTFLLGALVVDVLLLLVAGFFYPTPGFTDDPEYIRIYFERAKALIFFNASLIVIFGVRACRKTQNRRFLAGTLVIGVVIIDLFWAGQRMTTTGETDIYSIKPEVVDRIKGDRSSDSAHFRVFVPLKYWNRGYGSREIAPYVWTRNMLIEAINAPYHIFSAYGRYSLELRRVREFFELADRAVKANPALGNKMLSIANVKYIIGSTVATVPQYRPRAYVVSKASVIYMGDGDSEIARKQVLARMGSEDFDPKEEVVLEADSVVSLPEPGSKLDFNIERMEYRPNGVSISVSSLNDGVLLLADTYYPGWRAYVNGAETKIYRANYFQRAIVLPPGNSDVEFVYRPIPFMIGACVSALAVLIIIAVFLVSHTGRCKQKGAQHHED